MLRIVIVSQMGAPTWRIYGPFDMNEPKQMERMHFLMSEMRELNFMARTQDLYDCEDFLAGCAARKEHIQ